jgi:hypothetical protein
MQHGQRQHDVKRSDLFLKTETAVQTMLCEIEALVTSASYNKESAEFVQCITGVINETMARAQHNDAHMAATYDTLQTSTAEQIEDMLDNRQFSQCISESEEILRAMEEVMLAQQFSMPAVQQLFQGMNRTWSAGSSMVAARNQPRFREWCVQFTIRAKARLQMKNETERALEKMQQGVPYSGELEHTQQAVASMLAPTGNPDLHSFSSRLYCRFIAQISGHHYNPEQHLASLSLL